MLQKGLCKAIAASSLGTRSVTAAMHQGVRLVGTPTHQLCDSKASITFIAAAAEVTTLQTIVVAESGK
jgi:hypothetical protein